MRYMGLGLEEDEEEKGGLHSASKASSDSSGYFGVSVCTERMRAFYLLYRRSYINVSGPATACSDAPYYTTFNVCVHIQLGP